MRRITAKLMPLAQSGWYLIEVLGVSIQSPYPENRMAKALAMAGFSGLMEVYGPSSKDPSREILRITVDVEKYARHRSSETAEGFRRLPWTPDSLTALADAVAKLSARLKEGKLGPAAASGSLGKGQASSDDTDNGC